MSFPLTGGSWKKSAILITERLVNGFSGIIVNTSPNLQSSLETIEISSIIWHFISDNLFPKAVLDLSSPLSNFVPSLTLGPEWMVVPLTFTIILVGPTKRTLIKQCFWYGVMYYFH